MRLFFQLNEEEQVNAINYCVNIVIGDLIEKNVNIPDEEKELQAHINAVMLKIKDMETVEEKTNFIMQDEIAYNFVFEVAMEMSKSAFYHDDEEFILFVSDLNSATKSDPAKSDTETNPTVNKKSLN